MEVQIQKSGKKYDLHEENCKPLDINGVISVFENHESAELAVKQMQRAGFDMKKLSIVGKDLQTEENVTGYYNIGNRTRYWGKMGAFWGGLWGMLFGSAVFVIPGIGPLVVAGAFVSTLISAIEGAVLIGSLSALGAGLFSIGIPRDSIIEYENDIKTGKYLMIAHGEPKDLERAREIAKNIGAKNIYNFDSSKVPKKLIQ